MSRGQLTDAEAESGSVNFASCVLLSASLLLLPVAADASCWDEVGQHYGIDPLLLKAIAWQESRGQTRAVGPKLKGGNQALGLMQINTIHLSALAQFGVRRNDLFDACVSQKVGAWVLAHCIQRFGSIWKAVGCYYAGPASKNVNAQVAYVRKVHQFYNGYLQQNRKYSSDIAKSADFK